MLDDFTDSCFEDYVKLVHDLTGITIPATRKTMIAGRVRKRIIKLEIKGFPEYLDFVKTSNEEKVHFIDSVTTNETYFFRTPRVWDFISNVYLPNFNKKNPSKTLNIWSGASSSGEEASSLGIACHAFKKKVPSFTYSIKGSDISNEMVELCQKGLYSGRSIESFKTTRQEWFSSYMKQAGDEFQLIPEIKQHLRFQSHNLFSGPFRGEKFDLILLRNVLIYFTREDQEKVLKNIYASTSPEAILIIGESESLSHVKSDFAFIEPLIYKRSDATEAWDLLK